MIHITKQNCCTQYLILCVSTLGIHSNIMAHFNVNFNTETFYYCDQLTAMFINNRKSQFDWLVGNYVIDLLSCYPINETQLSLYITLVALYFDPDCTTLHRQLQCVRACVYEFHKVYLRITDYHNVAHLVMETPGHPSYK